jgi:ADP-dependent NAD(P)H-hydrate dehydratase
MKSEHSRIQTAFVDERSLRAWPLPMPPSDGDKEQRGRVLIIGGSREIPGAILLAANAALHAGAGKVTLAVGGSIAPQLALAVPEARVIALPESELGYALKESLQALETALPRADAILIGPGMQNEEAVCAFIDHALPIIGNGKLILDASAMGLVRYLPNASHAASDTQQAAHANGFLLRYEAQVLLTPHAGEMAHLSGLDKDEIASSPMAIALTAAQRWNATIALKGERTFIASPNGKLWQHEGGNIGLAVSGSGDTLAGIIAGLAARGASLEQACVWGVALHARAGEHLAKHSGPMGYLIRDLSAVVPMLMHQLSSS